MQDAFGHQFHATLAGAAAAAGSVAQAQATLSSLAPTAAAVRAAPLARCLRPRAWLRA